MLVKSSQTFIDKDFQQGETDCNNIFKLYGIKEIKAIAKYSTNGKNRYVTGKINRAQEIVRSSTKK